MNIPTLITIGRILAVPIAIWLILADHLMAAFWVFVLAGITDGIDGFLARRWNQRTELGAYLDAIADKALLVSIYITLAVAGQIPALLAITVVSRDLMIVGAVLLCWVIGRPLTIRPTVLSKANTLAQITFAALVLAAGGYGYETGWPYSAGVWIVALLTVASAGSYLAIWARHMAGHDGE
ncbi:CDP-diacylglycerol--glycerol-3-phosphate 3-phosphatidyltransferase [Agaricicola taiwanensis]|uniref:CDP-diacylglycerol--glycerol-3-phosphate 3-phosphatidyltransferase n=1 Tax=Agaricicola taiwanensis TaxID=591372 RepID=A0A8J3DW84_9RHOB|nr:CDP-alcohol phosphatidyltransferase family protein [Agaricicola taiwanensis]GGE43172.1 CDP-diacylglycerol--glycerol-3-phosphate 3-phosphatidyltransferase [Agaricicola taiwanensis]